MRAVEVGWVLFAFAVTATLAFGALSSHPAGAQVSDYPNRKLTFMVGFAPGGGIDTIARVIAQGLTEQSGYQIVIENRPFAASNIAARDSMAIAVNVSRPLLPHDITNEVSAPFARHREP